MVAVALDDDLVADLAYADVVEGPEAQAPSAGIEDLAQTGGDRVPALDPALIGLGREGQFVYGIGCVDARPAIDVTGDEGIERLGESSGKNGRG